MYMMYNRSMVRKQLYITEQQDRALKRQAKALGVSEAELVRQALDEMLREVLGARVHRREALDRLLDNTRRLAEHHRLPDGYRFDRDALYAEREDRWQQGTRR